MSQHNDCVSLNKLPWDLAHVQSVELSLSVQFPVRITDEIEMIIKFDRQIHYPDKYKK